MDLESKKGMKKQISMETVQQLLSQKEFVQRMLERSPEFLEIVSEEVKERVKKEVEGELDQPRFCRRPRTACRSTPVAS